MRNIWALTTVLLVITSGCLGGDSASGADVDTRGNGSDADLLAGPETTGEGDPETADEGLAHDASDADQAVGADQPGDGAGSPSNNATEEAAKPPAADGNATAPEPNESASTGNETIANDRGGTADAAPEDDSPSPDCLAGSADSTRVGASTVTDLQLTRFRSGFTQPIAVVGDPEDPGVVYVIERRGVIHRITPTSTGIYLDAASQVYDEHFEQGLLGLAFHPSYEENGVVFITFTPDPPGPGSSKHADRQSEEEYRHALSLMRFHAEPGATRIDWRDGEQVMMIRKPDPHHNAGTITFGPDCRLYLAIGDGGAADRSPEAHTRLGKIMRFDVDAHGNLTPAADNPFTNVTGDTSVWQLGLRNPWHFSFDRGTGDAWITDVGGARTEEVNHIPWPHAAGLDFGWPSYEGGYKRIQRDVAPDPYFFPVFDYNHTREGHCAIIGGHVYRGEAIPELRGSYLFGDFCSGTIWRLWYDEAGDVHAEVALRTSAMISGFGEDASGELYVIDWRQGVVSLLTRAG